MCLCLGGMTFTSVNPAFLPSASYAFLWLQRSQIDFFEALILDACFSTP